MKYLGKIQDNKDLVTKEYVDKKHILDSKTYTSVIGTANNWAGATFFFGKIQPTDYYITWKIHYRIYTEAAGRNDSKAIADVIVSGTQSSLIAYSSFNTIANTSYRPAYYHVLYRATSAGISSGYGHVLGLRLYSSWNPAASANSRTVFIDILSVENCTFTFFDSMTKYENIPGTGSTNYSSYSEIDYATNGLQETGDANDVNYYHRYYYASRKAVNTTYRYQYVLTKPNGDIVPVSTTNNSTSPTKTMNTEPFDPFGQIFWYYTTTTTNAGANVPNNVLYDNYFGDYAYSFNVAIGGLTAREPAYIVASPQSDGLAVLASPYITQSLPSSDDGLIYIYLGRVYEDSTTYRIYTSMHHPVYWYKNGHIQPFVKNAMTVNGHTVLSDVPANAVFTDTDTKVTAVSNHYTPSGGTTTSASGATGTSGTTVQVVTGVTKDAAGHVTGITSGAATDTTYESKAAASGGTAVSLVTTGEKYTWNNKSSLALGETSSTAYRGDRGKTAYDHSQSTHARTDATAVTASTTNGKIKINGTDTTVYTHPTTTAANAAAVKVGKDASGHVVLGNALTASDVSAVPTSRTVNGQALSSDVEITDAGITLSDDTTWSALGASTVDAALDYFLNNKQDALVSGTNIKTINNTSILGSGNISIGGGGAGTVTSVGVANATNGGMSISGSPVTSSGNITIGHSNVLSSAQTTQAIYPIKIDKNGHISAYGTAVTPLTASSSLDASKLTGTVPSGCYTDTTYESKTAASGGSDVSLCTTGEKYTWNNKQAALSTSTVTLTCTASTGTKVSATMRKYGNVVQFTLVFTNSSSIASGSNVFVGTLSTNKPLQTINACGYYGSAALPMSINTSGEIVVRNAGSAAVKCSSNTTIGATWLVNS